ncbi:MAG: amidohydrolase family protein, partial [Thermaerobacterales bacterium]
VAFDGQSHELLDGGCVVYEGSDILFVGFPDDPACPQVDRVLNAPGRLISPGLINLHCIANLDMQPMHMDFERRAGRLPAASGRRPHAWDDQGFRTSAKFSVAALLRHGTTTFCNVTAGKGYQDPKVEPIALAEWSQRLGARGYFAHNFQDIAGGVDEQGRRVTRHDAEEGRRGLQRAVELVEELQRNGDDRINGFLFPYQSEACSDALLQEASAAARSLGVTVRSHFAQYPRETLETLAERHMTPVQRLAELGVLGPELTLTHAIYLSGHPEVGGDPGADLKLLRESGTHVAHCPVVFARGGVILRSFQRYIDAGVNVALGTDTVPPDMLGEMRAASLLSKVADQSRTSGSARTVFDAATLAGAKALGRDDLGRLAPGARADISVFNLNALHVGVVDCPIKALIHYCSGADTETVIVDGRTVVEDGRLLGLPESELLDEAREAWTVYKGGVAESDAEGRSAAELYPPAYPIRSR